MKKRGHIIFAFILSFLFIYLTIYLGFSWFEFTWKSIILMSILIAFYSILPDIDHKSSYITWLFIGIGIFGLALAGIEFMLDIKNPNPLSIFAISLALLAFTFISSNFLKHRGWVHTVQAGLIAVCPTFFLFHSFVYVAIAYVAWHSHLLGDGFFFRTRG